MNVYIDFYYIFYPFQYRPRDHATSTTKVGVSFRNGLRRPNSRFCIGGGRRAHSNIQTPLLQNHHDNINKAQPCMSSSDFKLSNEQIHVRVRSVYLCAATTITIDSFLSM